jgi:putative transposase
MTMAESRKRYSSDLSSEQWRFIKHMIPPAGFGGRPRNHLMREIVNAILYRLKNGCVWEDLPHDFPPHTTVYDYFHDWSRDGTWQQIHDKLRNRVRQKAGKRIQPSAAIIDSQSVKTGKKGGLVATMPERK